MLVGHRAFKSNSHKTMCKYKIILSFESLLVLASDTQIFYLFVVCKVLFLSLLYLSLEFTFYRW